MTTEQKIIRAKVGELQVLHPACHDDPVEFYRLHGFYPDYLRRKEGSR